MILNVINQALTIGAAVAFAFLISYFVTILLVKINRKLLFAMPIAFAVFSAIFWILGLLSDDWGALGFLLYGSFGLIALVGSLISSIIIYKKIKRF